jgi:uncharacterized protein (DUF885 family)
MRKWTCLLYCSLLLGNTSSAQQPTPKMDSSIIRALRSMDDFRKQEWKADSAAGRSFGSNTKTDISRRNDFYTTLYRQLTAIDTSRLSFDDRINVELLKYDVEEDLSSYRYKMYLNPILSDEGFHTGLAGMGNETPSTVKDCEQYIRRLKDMPRYVSEQLALMREGLILGICQPKAILNGYENTYTRHIVDSPEKSIFYKPFLKKPFTISDTAWQRLTATAQQVVMQDAVGAFRQIKIFFDTEYLPKTRTTLGASHFPDGLAFYQDRTHHYTTTDLSYDSIYRLGINEVERIDREMQEVMNEVQFKGGFQAFINYLRTEPRFYAPTPEQLLKEASYIAKQADGMLPAFFGRLPRQPYGVEAVPAHLAPTYTAGRYAGASIYSKRAGHYWVNTYDLKSRPLYALEALTMHEAVPGHHLQIALTQELENLPAFRRNLYVNAFGEGWGLYAEYLGTEMGFYKDPYSRFGKLTYEMWRACRLVIDVGLHSRDWTRQQAVDYLAQHTALSLHEVNTEVNRYISWPGQALAYKMGELKIRELRKRAEQQLKDRFDIRAFHDMILSQGTVTLAILDMMTDRFIAEKLKK